ncbi:dihydrolipoyl dehydrogenase [Ruminococcaceae bacterium OttesenSCG-928-A16]|nr:dihydrolipoyl dehydrogenase [Ruminococcaceae bacterium OttesenSCG-928-A16]
METFDLVVIGSGPGGYVGAIRAAQLGFTVAIIEKGEIGGTCLNRGCMPTKALLHSAELYKEAKDNFATMGVECEGLAYNAAAMYARKNEVVQQLNSGVEQLLKANKIAIYNGTGRVVAVGKVEVSTGEETRLLATKHILLATGSKPAMPPIPGSNLPGVFTSDEMLANATIHPRLAIIGAGVIGVEFASLYAALGAQVHLIEAAPRALPAMGREVGQSVAMALKKDGVALYTGAMVQGIKQQNGALQCSFTQKEEEKTVDADAILVATGRKPVLENVVAEELALQTQNGFVQVDAHFCTNIAGVYAVGDIVAGMQLAHLASAQAEVAVEHMAGKTPSKNLSLVPACIYARPEVAVVGLTEEAAAEQGIAITANKFTLAANGRTLIAGAGRSYIKLIAQQQTGKLLGAELICPRATDLINPLTLAIANGLTTAQLGEIIYPHPTFGEAIGEAAAIFGDGAIHAAPRPKR